MALLFQDEALIGLMQDFYLLTGIKIVLFDENYTELISYPLDKKTFCMHMRENAEFDHKCKVSDESFCRKCSVTKTLEIYKCHAGLTEAIAPIKDNGRIIGYMMFGQVTDNKDREAFTLQMKALCKTYKIDKDLDKSIKKIKYKNTRQILAAAKILDALTEYILLKEMIHPSGKQLIDEIESFIDNHISEEITIERLCKEFKISRTKLYDIAKQHLGKGIAAFIKDKRLLKAKNLIKSTDMKIAEISYAVGFSDYNYFLREFKRKYGVSSKAYRNSLL